MDEAMYKHEDFSYFSYDSTVLFDLAKLQYLINDYHFSSTSFVGLFIILLSDF